MRFFLVGNGVLTLPGSFSLSRYDFFIVSQAVRSGSVSPTHYNVIYDSSGLKPDHIQRLTYKLCHVYYNWPVSALLSEFLLCLPALFSVLW